MSKIRVFISSTMDDLAKERSAVVSKFSEFNFVEPVYAEGLLPTGEGVWERIVRALNSCQLLILVIGDRYGWIPDEGPGAEEGLSVTHMEVKKAHQLKLPILPFVKRRGPDTPQDTEDAKRRQEFEDKVKRWNGGLWRAEFDDAPDLAEKVKDALLGLLTDNYLSAEVERRSKQAIPIPAPVEPERDTVVDGIDDVLTYVVRRRQAVLLAGAGMSLAAGFPSARAMSELLIAKMREARHRGPVPLAEAPFQKIAEVFEAHYGRELLLNIFRTAVSRPFNVEPTEAHRLGVQLFKTILTTNQDCLFESACEEAGMPFIVIDDDRPIPDSGEKTVIAKIDGSISSPERMLLTESEFENRHNVKPRFWKSLSETLLTSPLVVVGSSLRDPSLHELLFSRDEHLPGYIVSPFAGLFEQVRNQGIRLKGIEANADTLFRHLKREVG